MNSKNKFLILSIIVIFIAILGFSYANNQDNTINENLLNFFKEEISDIKGIINVNF